MKFKVFEGLFKLIKGQKEVRYKFIDSIPSSIRVVFFDNEITKSLYKEIGVLSEELFGEELLDDINYFLYECSSNCNIVKDNKEYYIKNEGDMVNYFKQAYSWDD